MKFKSVPGTKDILPSEVFQWQYIEQKIRTVFECFGYSEIRTPIFEDTHLFLRGIGETTDIVGKEMYTFKPNPDSDESLTLRPEMTASVMRSYLQHSLGTQTPVVKVFYISELFRKERPQKGRFRQFHQFGAECIGSSYAEADAELIAVMMMIYETFEVKNVRLRLNSLGNSNTRMKFRVVLQEYFRPHFDRLDPSSKERFEKNPLRILDSKNPDLKELIEHAPRLLDYLDEESLQHFNRVKLYLDQLGIKYHIDHKLVRGLDYYSRTAFELSSSELGSQDALGGGGRYDGLATQLGSPDEVPAIGFASGFERLLMVLNESSFFEAIVQKKTDVMLITQSPIAKEWVMKKGFEWRKQGLNVEVDLLSRSLKSQLREANRVGARYAAIIGETEMSTGKIQLKNLVTSEQIEISENDLVERVKKA